MSKNVLIVCTSAAEMPFKDGSDKMPTGVWLEEAAAPYYVFKEAGCNVTIASPNGGEIPVDQGSMKGDFYTADAKKFWESDAEAKSKLMESKKLDDEEKNVASYQAVFLAGGHGTCVDFPNNATLQSLLKKAHGNGAVIAAVCHGPMGLVNVKLDDGKSLLDGQEVTGFTDAEEGPGGVSLHEKVPFSLEGKMKEMGGKFKGADAWNSNVCCSGKLVTGQNPQSSSACAKKVVEIM